jgi:hypothetical protein
LLAVVGGKDIVLDPERTSRQVLRLVLADDAADLAERVQARAGAVVGDQLGQAQVECARSVAAHDLDLQIEGSARCAVRRGHPFGGAGHVGKAHRARTNPASFHFGKNLAESAIPGTGSSPRAALLVGKMSTRRVPIRETRLARLRAWPGPTPFSKA